MWLWILAGIPIGVVIGGAVLNQLRHNNVMSAYDTGYADGKAGRGYRKVQ